MLNGSIAREAHDSKVKCLRIPPLPVKAELCTGTVQLLHNARRYKVTQKQKTEKNFLLCILYRSMARLSMPLNYFFYYAQEHNDCMHTTL